jgi:stage V sporulation protein S
MEAHMSDPLATQLENDVYPRRGPAPFATPRQHPEIIKVSAQSRSTSVAGAIAGVVRDVRKAEVQAIGAGAVNQAIKAAAIARGYLLLDGIDVVIIPSFSDVDIDGSERTAVRLTIEPR